MTEAALLEQVLACPEDDAPRLAYADWLEERGDPRGEFIRVQCELARHSPAVAGWPPVGAAKQLGRLLALHRREAMLLGEHAGLWSAPFHSLADEVGFRRGFVEHVALPVETFLKRAQVLFARTPLAALTVIGEHREATRLAASKHVARLRSLSFRQSTIGHADGSRLAESPHLSGLLELDLSSALVEGVALRELLRSPALENLQTLILSGNWRLLGASAAWSRRPAPWSKLANLRWLELADTDVSDATLQGLEVWPGLGRLAVMNLARCPVSGTSLHGLISSPFWRRETLLKIGPRRYQRLYSHAAERLRPPAEVELLTMLESSLSLRGVSAIRPRS